MKAKQYIVVVLLGVLCATVSAQGKFKCQEAFTNFEAKVDAGDYATAYNVLAELRKNCRGFNQKLYTYGEIIFKHKIENAAPEEKKLLINDLSALYIESDKYYPQSDAALKNAMLLYDNKIISEQEVYTMLDAAFISKREFFLDPHALETYFLLYLKKYKEDQQKISPEQFIEKYGAVSAQVRSASNNVANLKEAILKKQEAQPLTNFEKTSLNSYNESIETLAAVGENIDILTSKLVNCDDLAKYYEKNYEAQLHDKGWLDAMVNSLINNKCYKAPVLLKGAQALHAANPTSQSAFNLAIIAQRNNDNKGAAAYYEESAQREPNQLKKADLYYRIASVVRSTDRGAAKKHALQSANLNPASGKPYIFLAELYSSASKECGLSPFEQKALIWLSIETIKKAEVAETKYKPTVAAMIEGYNKRLPSKEEIAGAGKRKGDKITYSCWINETVIIPNNK